MQATEKYLLEFINQNLDNPLVVDIGCSQGEFVDFVKNFGWHALSFNPVISEKKNISLRTIFILLIKNFVKA